MTRTEYFKMAGGINTADPALDLPPGELQDCRNYEAALLTGYRRIKGYERYDGQQRPSTESYWILNFTDGQHEPSLQDVITGGNSTDTGILQSYVLTSGAWLYPEWSALSNAEFVTAVYQRYTFTDGDASGVAFWNNALDTGGSRTDMIDDFETTYPTIRIQGDGYLVLRSCSDVFEDAETLTISGPLTVATADGTAIQRGATTDTLDETYLQAAMEAARNDIGAVPGSGPVRGVFVFNGDVYAFRDNAGGTACVLHKATSSGWSAFTMDHVLPFNSGSNEISEGDVIIGDTSGAQATVTHIHVDSGEWDPGNDAVGEIHFNPSTLTNGPFQSGEDIKVGVLTSAVATADSSIETFSPGGRFEFIEYNFYGSSGLNSIYGVNGVNKAFSFDGDDVRFIHTGMTNDAPTHVAAHKYHLFLVFPGGSVQHSSIGDPYEWNAITGAAEIALGDDCTGMQVLPGDTLFLTARNSRFILSGTSTADWNLITHSSAVGAVEWTMQDMGLPVYLDDRGLSMFEQSDAFGDFTTNTFSFKFQDALDSRKADLISSLRVRDKGQYRLHFSDNSILCVTFDNTKLVGATLLAYDHPIHCCCSAEDSTGAEVLYGGSDDGWVFQLDKGNNFDGEAIDAWVSPAFAHFKSPQDRKRFHKFVLDVKVESTIDLAFLADYSFGDTYYPTDYEGDLNTIIGGGGYWDVSTWERFYWDAPPIANAYGYLQGIGENISLFIRSVGTYDEPHTIQGIIFHYSKHGTRR